MAKDIILVTPVVVEEALDKRVKQGNLVETAIL